LRNQGESGHFAAKDATMSEATARRIEPQALPARAAELTVVIPTLNERDNIARWHALGSHLRRR
jgi:hypothetical protein